MTQNYLFNFPFSFYANFNTIISIFERISVNRNHQTLF